MHSRLPWRIDKDNDQGIEIVSSDGNLVIIEKYSDIPRETPPHLRKQFIQEARDNFYLILRAVNLSSE